MTLNIKTLFGCVLCIFGFVLLFITFALYQPESDTTTTQDIITFPKQRSNIRFREQTSRFDPVNSGETASGFVIVENIGNKTITDVAVRAGCTCSDIKLSETIINPGKYVRIDFSIDTRGKYVDFTDHFIVTYSEDGKNLFDVFYATVPILTPGKLAAEPASLLFNNARVGDSFSRVVKLQVKNLPENESVDIIDIFCPDWISVNLLRQDAYWELTLQGVFPNQSGRYAEFVRIKSNSERYSEMTIPIIVEYATVPVNDVIIPAAPARANPQFV